MKSLLDKVFVITGAGSGIGRALSLQCTALGADVSLSDINESGLAETKSLCQQQSPERRIETAIIDVSNREQVEQWANDTAMHFGKINGIINNAGVSLTVCIEEMSYDDIHWVMNINFWGVVHGTKAFLPHIKQSGDGHIVNISSLFGIIGVPNQSAYNASKFAVKGFTECLIGELAMEKSPISVTSVHPGGIKTNIANSGRLGKRLGKSMTDEQMKNLFNKKLAINTPEKAANDIINGMLKKRRRVVVGRDAKLLEIIHRIVPTRYHEILAAFM